MPVIRTEVGKMYLYLYANVYKNQTAICRNHWKQSKKR